MSAALAWLTNPAAPLHAFSTALGIPAEHWREREELTQLAYDDQALRRDAVAALQLDQVTPLTDAYGEALTCRFYLGDMPVLDVRRGVTDADLEEFRNLTASTPTVIFDFRLDKARLVAEWLGAQPHTRLFLYLFPEALERLLATSLPQLETLLWGMEPDCRVVVLVPGRDVWLVGEWLAILGGAGVAAWSAALPADSPDSKRAREIYDRRVDTVRWQETWLAFLTPLHLRVSGRSTPDGPIADAVRTHLVNLIILYTADRTVTRAGQWLATYSSAQEAVEVPLAAPDGLRGVDAAAHVETLGRLFDWVYEPKWAVDRLLLIQVTAGQALHEIASTDRCRRLLERADSLYKDLQRQWKSFIEGKLDAYTDQVRTLEDYVAATVQFHADQVAVITKSLSDTMLAAVAALLASFIAAIFQNKFNQAVFGLGMVVYAVYVLCFPLAYNMLYQWQRYRALASDFAARRRFEERLSEEQVEEIVSTRVAASRARFERWFWVTVAIYFLAVYLALLATVVVPRVVGVGPSPRTPTPRTTPAITRPRTPPTVKPAVHIRMPAHY